MYCFTPIDQLSFDRFFFFSVNLFLLHCHICWHLCCLMVVWGSGYQMAYFVSHCTLIQCCTATITASVLCHPLTNIVNSDECPFDSLRRTAGNRVKIKLHNVRPVLSFSLWFSLKSTLCHRSEMCSRVAVNWSVMCVVAVMGCGGSTSNSIDSLWAEETSKLEE